LKHAAGVGPIEGAAENVVPVLAEFVDRGGKVAHVGERAVPKGGAGETGREIFGALPEPPSCRGGPGLAKEQVSGMTKKLLVALGILSLVACGGSGKSWGGDGTAPDGGWPASESGGSSTVPEGRSVVGGGSGIATGGYGPDGTPAVGGSGIAAGGYGPDGTPAVGGSGIAAGGYGPDGTPAVGGSGVAAGGGSASGGSGYGGFESDGTPRGSACSQNVVHCFDAAANCYQYSPASDCDEIVDVCAAMQSACNQ